jgi:hypothetical protein
MEEEKLEERRVGFRNLREAREIKDEIILSRRRNGGRSSRGGGGWMSGFHSFNFSRIYFKFIAYFKLILTFKDRQNITLNYKNHK